MSITSELRDGFQSALVNDFFHTADTLRFTQVQITAEQTENGIVLTNDMLNGISYNDCTAKIDTVSFGNLDAWNW